MRVVIMVVLALLVLAACSAADNPPAPVGVTSKTIGGGDLNAYTHGVEGGQGLNNIGILVRIWGKVTYVDEDHQFFYVDDGGARDDGSGHLGIRVSYDDLAQGRSFDPPGETWIVAVTGISSTWVNAQGKVQPNVLPRSSADMVQF